MSRISLIQCKVKVAEAAGIYNKLFKRVNGPNHNIDYIMLVHSLFLYSMVAYITLLKNVLHDSKNKILKWFLKTIGEYVSKLKKYFFCVKHHLKGLEKLLKKNQKFNNIIVNLQSHLFCKIFDNKYEKALIYSKLLTLNPTVVLKKNIDELIGI